MDERLVWRCGSLQPVVQVTASTETGDAPGSQGATTENIEHI